MTTTPLSKLRAVEPIPVRLVAEREAPPSVSDDTLAKAIRDGDGRVGALLHARLNAPMRRVLRPLSGSNSSDLEDLVQLAFERVILSLKRGGFREGANLESWAAVIATRVGLDHLRSTYRRRKYFFFGEAPEPQSHSHSQVTDLELREVRRALADLNQEHVEVLFLHDAMGYDLREIAEQLDITTAAAQSRLVRTRKELIRRLVAREGGRK